MKPRNEGKIQRPSRGVNFSRPGFGARAALLVIGHRAGTLEDPQENGVAGEA